MRSADAWQAYEAKQQRLVQHIIDDLHQTTRDDEKYVEFFCKMEICILQDLNGWAIRNPENENEYRRLIAEPVSKFAPGGEEREFLLTRVAEKILGSISARVSGAYNAQLLVEEMALK